MSEAMTEMTQAEQAYFTTRGESGQPEEDNYEAAGMVPEQEMVQVDMPDKLQGSRMVPHGALHAEREEHKKTRAALQQLRAEAAQMQENFQALMAANAEQAMVAADGMPPDPEQDFVGFIRWQVDELNRLKMQMEEDRQRQEWQERAVEMENRLWQEWGQSVAVTRNEQADIDGAIQFLAEARDRQLGVLGQVDRRFQDKAVREGQMQAELREIVVASLQQGQNPARTIYEIARAYGYDGGEGQRIAQLQSAQAAARTLTAMQGREAGDPMLLETVANLSETDFAKWYENNKGSFRKMFGG
ncbi:MAG: Hypothetical protein BHV28_00740 [Candidatus Tokpelaia hoelldobleri]|uniref:Uncharacterized protein n=1 Tax=Candidatus Tokpelaia hoelldobleri TaxID=1902579 RepID=A0A1U9JSG2_9HYPH|nr:MAG: Hypothetical protein BHV28_00740 [Candidatus Tokpelaia hoelldoblerii]